MPALMDTYSRFPVAFIRGSGSYLWDDKGDKYLDFGSGISVTNLGHCNEAVTSAICEQARTLIHTSNLYMIPKQEELAELISKNSFGGKVFFCNSGAEANEAAIKLARIYGNKKYSGARYKIVSMYNSFHGRTYATLSATAQSKIQKGFTPIAGYNSYVPLNDIEAFEYAISFGDVAAVIIELFQGEGGVVPADKEYLKKLREICTANDILLIFDEVQTGFGRTGNLFGYQQVGVTPDIMTLAKAIANGLPMGALVANKSVAEYFTPGTHGSTFGGTPLVCAAGVAVMGEMLKPGFLSDVVKKGELMKDIIKKSLGDKCTLRGTGLLIGAETKFDPKNVASACLEERLLVITAGNNSVRLYPPLTATMDEIKNGAEIYAGVIKKMESIK